MGDFLRKLFDFRLDLIKIHPTKQHRQKNKKGF